MDALASALARSPVLARMFGEPAEPGNHKGPGGEQKEEQEDPTARLPVDSQGRVFLPYPPDCFAAVLDLLHGLAWMDVGLSGAGDFRTGGAAAAAPSSAERFLPTAAPPPPPPPSWWRDRVAPGREPILRQLIAELGLQGLVHALGAGAASAGRGGEVGFRGGPAPTPAEAGRVGNMYARLAALGR